MKLIDNWDKAWRLWSVQLNIITIVILTILNDLPSHIIAGWSLLPEDLKAQIDKDVIAYVSIGLVVLNILSRLVSQTRETVKHELEELQKTEKEKDPEKDTDKKEE